MCEFKRDGDTVVMKDCGKCTCSFSTTQHVYDPSTGHCKRCGA